MARGDAAEQIYSLFKIPARRGIVKCSQSV